MVDTSTLGALLVHVRSALRDAGNSDAALDARLIVEHATGASRLDIVTDPGRTVLPRQVDDSLAMLARRLAGEPVHRILGFREFYGLRLNLSKETLEPRPDTESLIELALPLVRTAVERQDTCRILDLGTGTGAIALALLSEEPRAHALGVDISADALATAAANADINGLADRFDTRLSHWYAAVEGQFHVIVSNPPYIRSKVIETLSPEVRLHDPLAALDGGPDGLDAYRLIVRDARAHLVDDGYVAVEIGHDQEMDVAALFAVAGFAPAGSAKDLTGHVRALAFGV